MNKKLISIFLIIAMLLSLGSVSIFAEVVNDENTKIIVEQKDKNDSYVISFSKAKVNAIAIAALAVTSLIVAYAAGYIASNNNSLTIREIYRIAPEFTAGEIASIAGKYAKYKVTNGFKYVWPKITDGVSYGTSGIASGLSYGANGIQTTAKALWSLLASDNSVDAKTLDSGNLVDVVKDAVGITSMRRDS